MVCRVVKHTFATIQTRTNCRIYFTKYRSPPLRIRQPIFCPRISMCRKNIVDTNNRSVRSKCMQDGGFSGIRKSANNHERFLFFTKIFNKLALFFQHNSQKCLERQWMLAARGIVHADSEYYANVYTNTPNAITTTPSTASNVRDIFTTEREIISGNKMYVMPFKRMSHPSTVTSSV